jgi:hypothetical protein
MNRAINAQFDKQSKAADRLMFNRPAAQHAYPLQDTGSFLEAQTNA